MLVVNFYIILLLPISTIYSIQSAQVNYSPSYLSVPVIYMFNCYQVCFCLLRLSSSDEMTYMYKKIQFRLHSRDRVEYFGEHL